MKKKYFKWEKFLTTKTLEPGYLVMYREWETKKELMYVVLDGFGLYLQAIRGDKQMSLVQFSELGVHVNNNGCIDGKIITVCKVTKQ